MSKTVKRALWQRTLETAGPLRKALPQAPALVRRSISELLAVHVRFDASAVEAQLAQWRRAVEQVDERGYRQARRVQLIGMDFAQGGMRGQTLCLVGEVGPELVLTIPAGGLKVSKPSSPSQYDDPLVIAMQYFVREINEGLKK